MLKSCSYCGRIHPRGYECPKKPPRRAKLKGRTADRLRSSYAWQRKREHVKERDHYLCRYCLAHGAFVYKDLEVHHIIPIEERPELALVDSNAITLCETDHERAERGEIGRKELLELAKSPPILPEGNFETPPHRRPPTEREKI